MQREITGLGRDTEALSVCVGDVQAAEVPHILEIVVHEKHVEA